MPTLRLDVPNVAVPLLPTDPVPSVVLLVVSVNVTVPVRVPAPGLTALTVAVKVTFCPACEGLAEEVNAVVVLAWLTVCCNTELVLLANVLLPP